MIGKAAILSVSICLLSAVAFGQGYTSTATARQNFSCDKYVATDGTSGGSGAIGSPWDLQTALSHSGLGGQTVCLRGGTYNGKYVADLSGSAGNLVTFRSYPTEWAVVDGYGHTTLNGSITNSGTSITLTDASSFGTQNIMAVIDSEVILLRNRSGNNYTNCIRGYNGSSAASHTSGATVIAKGDAITVTGSYIVFRDFEVKHSDPNREFTGNVNDGLMPNRGEGFNMSGPHCKVINMVLHDNQEGLGFWDGAYDSEAYGDIIFNNGMVDSIRGHGHGIYTQNSNSAGKAIKEIITFNNYATGMKMYGNAAGNASYYTIEGVVSFNNGSPAGYTGNPAGQTSEMRESDLFHGTEVTQSTNVTVQQCYVYDPPDTVGGGAQAGYIATGNTVGLWQDSYFLGAYRGFQIYDWASLTFRRNFVWGKNTGTWDSDGLVTLTRGTEAIGNYTLNDNVYYDETAIIGTCPNGPTGRYPFGDSGTNSDCNNSVPGNRTSWAAWQAITSWESGSVYHDGAPTTNVIAVRPNTYDADRAHVVVMNWEGATSVNVDVSAVFSDGDTLAVYAAENLLGSSVATPTVSGGIVSIPVNGTTVAMPTGSPGSFTPTSVRPQFGVFVIIRTAIGSFTHAVGRLIASRLNATRTIAVNRTTSVVRTAVP